MKKCYYLSSCSTCKRILNEWQPGNDVVLQDVKTNPITEKELEQLQKLAGSYEALFSKRAQLYKERGLKNKQLSENDFKNLLLEHYTFLKRPILVIKNNIFIGNTPKVTAEAKETIDKER